MPPWFANPEHGKWANDARLSQEEIYTIVAWVEGGAKRGDRSQMPEPPVFTAGWQLGEPDYVIDLPAVTVPAEGLDVFRNPIVRIDLPERRWVRAVEFRPGDREVSHHQGAFMVDLAGLMATGGGDTSSLRAQSAPSTNRGTSMRSGCGPQASHRSSFRKARGAGLSRG
ncbi:MAG: hypothetical protein J4F98_15535 [Acidobacteria bacterium]|nr:hypothetical protein [Acidobacteriota bacterium]